MCAKINTVHFQVECAEVFQAVFNIDAFALMLNRKFKMAAVFFPLIFKRKTISMKFTLQC